MRNQAVNKQTFVGTLIREKGGDEETTKHYTTLSKAREALEKLISEQPGEPYFDAYITRFEYDSDGNEMAVEEYWI